jgi:hypothetical protein
MSWRTVVAGINLNGLSYWSTELAFVDVSKSSGTWVPHDFTSYVAVWDYVSLGGDWQPGLVRGHRRLQHVQYAVQGTQHLHRVVRVLGEESSRELQGPGPPGAWRVFWKSLNRRWQPSLDCHQICCPSVREQQPPLFTCDGCTTCVALRVSGTRGTLAPTLPLTAMGTPRLLHPTSASAPCTCETCLRTASPGAMWCCTTVTASSPPGCPSE